MAISRAWDEANPAAPQFIDTGPGYFQNHQVDVRERASNGGHVWNNANKDLDGLHAVNASGGGTPSPDIYKSDFVTKILAWADAAATLLAGYQLNGSKNIPEATVNDDIIGVDAKGYKRALRGLRVYESAPADTKVNVAPGIYRHSTSTKVIYYAGGFLTIGAGALALPAAGNEASYAIVLDSSGTLTARKGAEVLTGAGSVDPSVNLLDTILAMIRIRWDSVNFSLAVSGVNAILIHDGRVDQEPSLQSLFQAGGETSGFGAVGAVNTTIASQAITTAGGLVLVIAVLDAVGGTDISVYRDATEIFGKSSIASGISTLIHIDNPTAAVHTYAVKKSSPGAISYRFYVLELPASVLA